jgi:hypothetical protein
MTAPLGNYTFLPWLRQGLANRIGTASAASLRAQVQVDLELTGEALAGGELHEPISRTVELYGPGDVVGLDARAILRTEPRDWITDFEPNYLAAIEFYDEDFPWRYTPAAPDAATGRLTPWLALIVLREDEFADATVPGRPLPAIAVVAAAPLPASDELWAWAHVHVNRSLLPTGATTTSDDMGAVLPLLEAALQENADLGYSRLVCPRRLQENTAYHAFLVPAFESGRLAGLGLDTAPAPDATHSAWAPYAGQPEAGSLPYYHRWYFRTGAVGDFEYLVRLLRPRPVDPRVGVRDMDVLRPGANLPAIDDPALRGVLALGGALQVPREVLDEPAQAERDRMERWAEPYPHPFQRALSDLVDLADDYAATAAATANRASNLGPGVQFDPDPLVVPPIYARWHSRTARLLRARDGTPLDPDDNWVHQLNLDPRHRVAAGFGTLVAQDGQEAMMDAAWSQVGDVLEANRRLRAAQLVRELAVVWRTRHLAPLVTAAPGRTLAIAAPLHARVLDGDLTAAARVRASSLPTAALSVAARRALRPAGRIARGAGLAEPAAAGALVERLADGQATAAPPRPPPAGGVSVDDVAEAGRPAAVPRWLADLLSRFPLVRFAPLVLALLVVVVVLLTGGTPALVAGLAIAALLVLVWLALERWLPGIRRANALREDAQTPAGVAELPTSPDFRIALPGSGTTPRTGATDSPDATRFKEALLDSAVLQQTARAVAVEREAPRLDVAALAGQVHVAIDPDRTVARRVRTSVSVPGRLGTPRADELDEVMAYPRIDTPMYRPLVDRSSELFLPRLGLIEQNSLTLLETNQRFIEAYMVGLNHEFARELLWREYPTDQRGTVFRQFWDPSGFLGQTDDAALRETLRDIPPIHTWDLRSALGEHDNRDAGGPAEEELVLVIRGDLLKRYPNAVIYAHRASWARKADGSIDPATERTLAPIADESAPPRDLVKTPLYEARVDPDIAFIGFDLTAPVARGGTGEHPDDDPGWFFVIKERPGEPRFGFDVSRDAPLEVWNDLAWPDVLPAGELVPVGAGAPEPTLGTPSAQDEQEKIDQHSEDVRVRWGPGMTAADAAYVLFQAPVLVAVHAAEMLTPRTGDGAGLPRP